MFRSPQPIIASTQLGIPNQTDVFTVGRSGGLHVFWVNGLGPWEGPATISPNGRFPEGAGVAASPQYGVENQTDVFAVDNRGQLQVFWVTADGPWSGPTNIGPAGMFPPGAAVAASAQYGAENQTDVFAVDNLGQLQVFWVTGLGAWSGPTAISPIGMFPPGAPIMASAQYGAENQTDVFAVDNNGQLRVFWVTGLGPWSGPTNIGPAGMFPPGAALTVSPQYGAENQTDVFAVDNHGQLRVFWVTGLGPWSGPAAISPAGMFPPGTSVAASAQYGVKDQTDVFAVDNNGQLRVFWVTGLGPWSGPANIGQAIFPRGASVAASQQHGVADQTDVFAVDRNGDLQVFWVTGLGPWSGPTKIGTPLVLASAGHAMAAGS